MSLRLVFMGTPGFSVPTLKALHDADHEICAVYSQPPAKSGRGMKLRPSPVHQCAQELGLEVLTPSSFREDEELQYFQALNADIVIVVAYGMILPQAILDAPRFGCLNIHASLLPRWRGAAPIQRAIMAGDAKTGVTIMQMEAGLDTGPMCAKKEIAITDTTTAGQLHDDLSQMGADLVVPTVAQVGKGSLSCVAQPAEGVTYAKKISKAEARIDFSLPASKVLRHIHGLSPFPGSWFELRGDKDPQRIKILLAEKVSGSGEPGQVLDERLTIACGQDAIRPVRLQRQGKSAMNLEDFLRGGKVLPGMIC